MQVAICKFSFVLDLSRLLLVLNKWIMKNGTSEEEKKIEKTNNIHEWLWNGNAKIMRKYADKTATISTRMPSEKKKRCQKEIRKQHRAPKTMNECERKKTYTSTEQKERQKKKMTEKSCWTAVRWNKLSP